MRIRKVSIASLCLLTLGVAVMTTAAAAGYGATSDVVISTVQGQGSVMAAAPGASAAGNAFVAGLRGLGSASEPVGLVLLASVLMVIGRVARAGLKLQTESE